ncbi:hypothetical protein F5148DRAFT_1258745 [Russula earlei]|uniref:Uncharacterized protein n=1 Tax=Russula earlei TaxID=71964 RepID=A0ACC0TTB9_9AGAM|nr:hypothetical protein F5148DRAFT_1258745 [Russula earlei]
MYFEKLHFHPLRHLRLLGVSREFSQDYFPARVSNGHLYVTPSLISAVVPTCTSQPYNGIVTIDVPIVAVPRRPIHSDHFPRHQYMADSRRTEPFHFIRLGCDHGMTFFRSACVKNGSSVQISVSDLFRRCGVEESMSMSIIHISRDYTTRFNHEAFDHSTISERSTIKLKWHVAWKLVASTVPLGTCDDSGFPPSSRRHCRRIEDGGRLRLENNRWMERSMGSVKTFWDLSSFPSLAAWVQRHGPVWWFVRATRGVAHGHQR